MDYEKALRDAYERGYNEGLKDNGVNAVLADVRAWIEKNKNLADHYCVDVEVVRVEKLDDFLFKYISEHFS